jgi:glycosyltransferase involved in cell wall biosynthesis
VKILWVCGSRIVGGSERVTLQLAALLQERGHTVEALCRPDSGVRSALARTGLTTHLARLGGSLNFRAVAAIRRALSSITPDVAVVTTADEWVWSCLARTRAPRCRLVLVRHMALRLNSRVRWLASHRADAVVAVSDSVRQSLIGRLGVSPERIHVIHNPVRFSPRATIPSADDRVRARQSLGLPSSGRWVGFFGGLSTAKGLRDVMLAVGRANEQLGDINLLVCGRPADGRNGGSVADLTSEFRIEDRVHYLGEIEAVEDALTAVNVVVMATHRELSEALPATLLEAMACGTPVLGYATGGIVDAIGADGQAGRLARADDAGDLARHLIESFADPTGTQQMAVAALARARRLFDPQQAADRYEQLFSALCSR